MEEKKEHQNQYSSKTLVNLSQMTTQCDSIVGKKTGRWSFEEHQTFINCLKKYGKNWVILQEMIPTRTNIQIKSHCQNYLDQIKKDFKTDDPMELVLKNVCDASPIYQSDLPESSQSQVTPLIIDSSEFGCKYNLQHKKKREFKSLVKNMDNTSSPMIRKEGQPYKTGNLDSSERILKKQKVFDKGIGPSSNCNVTTKNMSKCVSSKQNQRSRKADNKSQLKVEKGCSLIGLNKGKITIKADSIQSLLPFEYKLLSDQINMFIPEGPCQINIMPLSQANCGMGSDLVSNQSLTIPGKVKINTNKAEYLGASTFHSSNMLDSRVLYPQEIKEDLESLEAVEIIKQMFCGCSSSN
ncbi:unnamed protein product [Moneuplotes crassus]|uniref:Uncharacterized protein n=1 Tax=Euplotes crassus TaxID=5936 RepID=A0AAD1Y2X1_EUPCR|nr:unnamed protein product [Moneuplotes crassus]